MWELDVPDPVYCVCTLRNEDELSFCFKQTMFFYFFIGVVFPVWLCVSEEIKCRIHSHFTKNLLFTLWTCTETNKLNHVNDLLFQYTLQSLCSTHNFKFHPPNSNCIPLLKIFQVAFGFTRIQINLFWISVNQTTFGL